MISPIRSSKFCLQVTKRPTDIETSFVCRALCGGSTLCVVQVSNLSCHWRFCITLGLGCAFWKEATCRLLTLGLSFGVLLYLWRSRCPSAGIVSTSETCEEFRPALLRSCSSPRLCLDLADVWVSTRLSLLTWTKGQFVPNLHCFLSYAARRIPVVAVLVCFTATFLVADLFLTGLCLSSC